MGSAVPLTGAGRGLGPRVRPTTLVTGSAPSPSPVTALHQARFRPSSTGVQAGQSVLHLDKDFELIAAITGDPCESLGTPTD